MILTLWSDGFQHCFIYPSTTTNGNKAVKIFCNLQLLILVNVCFDCASHVKLPKDNEGEANT